MKCFMLRKGEMLKIEGSLPFIESLLAHSSHQSGKTCLLEMMISGQRFGQTLLRHHQEGNAVGKRPPLSGRSS